MLSLGLSFATISFWSLYFDVKDWKIRYGEWQKSVMTQSISDVTMQQHKENRNQNLDDTDSGINIVNANMNENNSNKNKDNISERESTVRLIKPMLGRQQVLNNAYEPCKLFFLCNGPIWLLSGSMTGLIAARIMTNSILLTPAMAITGLVAIDHCNQSNLALLDDE